MEWLAVRFSPKPYVLIDGSVNKVMLRTSVDRRLRDNGMLFLRTSARNCTVSS